MISVLRSTRAYASALINQSGAGECRLHLLSILPHSKRMSYLPIAFLCAFLWSAQCPFWLQTRANTERSGVSIFFDDISVFWTMYGFVSAMYGFVSAVSCQQFRVSTRGYMDTLTRACLKKKLDRISRPRGLRGGSVDGRKTFSGKKCPVKRNTFGEKEPMN